jgi:hypothetical protein
MSVIIGGVACEELVDGLEEGVREGGPYAVKKYLCDWGSRYQLANAFLGLVNGSGGKTPSVTFQKPQQYPESRNMWAREIAIKGVGQPTQGPLQLQFPKAIITVNYGVPQFGYLQYPDQNLDPSKPYIYATQEIHFSREMVAIDNSSCTLANGHSLNTTIPYSFPLPVANLTIQLHKVPYLPWAQIWDSMQNPLNDSTFLGVDRGYLMFNGADTHEEASTDGTYVQELTLNFSARGILAWDEMFDPDGVSGPQIVYYNGSGIIGTSDLSLLIPTAYEGS